MNENQKRMDNRQLEHLFTESSKESEFGKGFFYSLILFAQHLETKYVFETARSLKQVYEASKDDPTLKDNHVVDNPVATMILACLSGARDHLDEMKVPEIFKGTDIEKEVDELKALVEKQYGIFHDTDDETSLKNFAEMIRLTNHIAYLIDLYMNVKPVKACWE